MTDLMLPPIDTTATQASEPRASRRPPRACTLRPPPSDSSSSSPLERHRQQRRDHFSSSSDDHRDDTDPAAVPVGAGAPAPAPSQEERWQLRNMWELASVVNFMNVFRPALHFSDEFSIEDLETALLTPNALLGRVHIDLLKAIPPVSKNFLTLETWVTALCKKMKDWWSWVAEDSFPLIPNHGEENVKYKELSASDRVCMLKALCEVRLEQDDIRDYIDEILKNGSLFLIRKEMTGSVTQTIYWYENDPVAGQRLYKEQHGPFKNEKVSKGRLVPPPTSQWETLATSLDGFETVAEKLSSSRNKTEAAIGNKMSLEILPELIELQKKKERALKKQQRQAQLLDNSFRVEGIATGRARRERKPVSYTFDDFDRSINDAIKYNNIRLPSPDPVVSSDSQEAGSPIMSGQSSQLSGPCNDTTDGNELEQRISDCSVGNDHYNVRKRKLDPEIALEGHENIKKINLNDEAEIDLNCVSKVETKEKSQDDINPVKTEVSPCDSLCETSKPRYLDLNLDGAGLSISDSCRSPHLVPKLEKCTDDLSTY